MQNSIIGKIATQVKASKLTEDQLTKRILMQDQIADIENRLEKLKQPIKIDSDDEGGSGSGEGGGGDGGVPTTPLPPTTVRKYKPRPEKDSYDELMDRYNKLKSSLPPRPLTPSPSYSDATYPLLPSFNDLLHLRSKATGRPSMPGMPDTPPPTPVTDDYFPPPSVDLADDSFTLPDVPNKPLIPPKPVIFKSSTPPKPVLDTFSRRLTKIIDSKKNKIQIISKKIESNDIDNVNLSKQLSKLFPEINQVTEEKIDDEKSEIDMENLTEILSKIGDEKPFEFEFYTGHEDKKFDDTMRSYGLPTDNLEFLYLLQSEICKKVLTTNKLKIHVETGNIYYNNNDTSESTFDFFLKQQYPAKEINEHHFVYSGTYNDYFQWLIDGFDSQEKTKLDVLTSKNAKFFLYRMNELLQANNLPLKNVKT